MNNQSPNHKQPLGAAREPQKKMKILFISPRPFGLMGTPGTYLLTESYGKIADVCVISNKEKNKNTPIVYENTNQIPIHEISFNKKKFWAEAEPIIRNFSPRVVILGNYARWFDIAGALKDNFNDVVVVLDIKSPLIVDNDPGALKKIKEQGVLNAGLLDLIMTRCTEDVETWIPGYSAETLVYPLGIKACDYSPVKIKEPAVQCRRFVYVGALHPRRKLDQMVRYIHRLPDAVKNRLIFDIYGSGPALKELESLAEELKLENVVRFKGYLETRTLAEKLSEYDAGIAWVPYDVYNAAPSLKLMEYLAAGLVPVAMDTKAHLSYADMGFHIEFFSDDAQSFQTVIENLSEKGIKASRRLANLERIKDFDWDVIAKNTIMPVLNRLIAPVPEKAPVSPAESCAPSKSYENVHMWDLPFEPENVERVSSSTLKIAGILGDRLFSGLDPECDLFLLTPDNWDGVIEYGRPDFLLVESTWITATDHWYMGQTISGEANEQLKDIIKLAGNKGIPTVFWMTLDHAYHHHFCEFAKGFDFVFCADPACMECFEKQGISAKLLRPAVQPVLFNPALPAGEKTPFHAGILFDGWVDLFKFPDIGRVLAKVKQDDLNIYQTRLMMYKAQLQRTDPGLVPFVQGTVSDIVLPGLLKRADMVLSFEKSGLTRTQKTWNLLEAAASRVPVAHLGSLGNDNFLSGLIRSFDHEADFCDYVSQKKDNRLALEKDRQQAWRRTFLDHVFAKRLQTICREIGIKYDWDEFPKASLVTGTMRENLLPKCFEQFESQTYPNKELILVFNGANGRIEPFQKEYAQRDDISITSIPMESTVGTVLNYGLFKATGKYFFRIDDDDIYGPEYIMDTLLYQRAVKAEIFGKRASFFHFEGENDIYLRNRFMPDVKSFPAERLHENQDFLISGCSFAGSIPFLKQYRFPDFIQASVDSALIEKIKSRSPHAKCLLTDNLNLVVERAADVSSHTWRMDADAIKRKSEIITTRFEDVIC